MSRNRVFLLFVQLIAAGILLLMTEASAQSQAQLNCNAQYRACLAGAANNHRQCAVYPYQRTQCTINYRSQNRSCYAYWLRCSCGAGYRPACTAVIR